MFDDDFFIKWLDQEANKSMLKLNKELQLSSNEMMVLMLKAQTNHIDHLETDLRGELLSLRKDMDKKFEQADKKIEQVDKKIEQMDKRFEQVDKNFEQIDKSFQHVSKSFEQVDNRFEHLAQRIDIFMRWSFAVTIAVGGLVVTLTKVLPG